MMIEGYTDRKPNVAIRPTESQQMPVFRASRGVPMLTSATSPEHSSCWETACRWGWAS